MGTGKNSEWIDRLSQLLVLFISYILVPGSYLLNDEVTKLLIVANGWTKFFHNKFPNTRKGVNRQINTN